MRAHVKPGVLVIGGGVTGLTTAWSLRSGGFDVTVLADKFAPGITSNVAGALWEWPPAVCGYHHDQLSLSRSKRWCMTSYERFAELANDPRTGVFMRRVTFYFRRPVAEDARQYRKMNELKDKIAGFAHDPCLIGENGVNPNLGLRDAYSHLAPMIDTDVYMRWLLEQVRTSGCRILQQRLTGPLQEQERDLRMRFRAEAIVNCSGLGSRELAGEFMYPLRGALVRVRNDGSRFPRIEQAHCVSHDESTSAQDIVFIVPRGRDMLVLGGLAEPDRWGLDIGLVNYEPVREMYRRCVEFLPVLRDAELDPEEPVRVGLRPFRRANVRLDHAYDTRIIHNYGHGGAGVTFSWGCAEEAVDMVQHLLSLGESVCHSVKVQV